jgi:hypothetical protein
MFVTPEELLAGREATYDIAIPPQILHPSPDGRLADAEVNNMGDRKVRLRPLTVKDVQLIAKAAKDDEVLTSVLMIQRALVEPSLKQAQIAEMHSGLVGFLVERINHISGLTTSDDEMRAFVEAPLVRAFFVLAREFNWTPEQVRELTIGQILGYLEMLNQAKQHAL